MIKKIALFLFRMIVLGCAIFLGLSFQKRNQKSNMPFSYQESTAVLMEKKVTKDLGVYETFLKQLSTTGKPYYYKLVLLDAYEEPVLVLTDSVYQSNNEEKVTMGADIYYLVDDKVTYFGDIWSNGTAYPIAADSTGIYAAGGHHVSKYSLNVKQHELSLIYNIEVIYKPTGHGEDVSSLTIETKGGKNRVVNESEFERAIDDYGNAKTLIFQRL